MTAFIRSRLAIRRQVTRAASFVWKQWEQRHTAPTRLKRWIDAWWGYDVFIAHRHVDAATYAKATFEALKAKRISAFIDCEVYGTGDSLLTATPRHVRKSALLLVVGSPELLKPRTPVDWVQQEVDDYLLSHEDPKVVVVDPGGALGAAISAATPSTSSLLATLQPFLRGAPEPTDALTNPPSPAVTEAIEWQLAGRRRDQSRLWFFQVTAGVLAVLLVGVVVLAFLSERQRRVADEQRALAVQRRQEALDAQKLATEQRDRAQNLLYVRQVNDIESSGARGALEILRETTNVTPSLRGFEWNYLGRRYATELQSLSQKYSQEQSRAAAEASDFHVDAIRFVSEDRFAVVLANFSHEKEVKVWRLIPGQPAVNETNIPTYGARAVEICRDFIIAGTEYLPDFKQTTLTGLMRLDLSGDTAGSVLVKDLPTIIDAIACSPTGEEFAAISRDGVMRIRSSNSGRVTATYDLLGPRMSRLRYSPDGRWIVAGGERDVRLIDVRRSSGSSVIDRDSTSVSALAFSPDGNTLAVARRQRPTRIIDMPSGRRRSLVAVPNGMSVNALEFSADGQILAAAMSDGTIELWNRGDLTHADTLPSHESGAEALAFSPTSATLVSGDSGGVVKVWNPARRAGPERLTLEHAEHDRARLSSDGRSAALAKGSALAVWDTVTRRLVRSLASPTPDVEIFSLAFSNDATTIAVGTQARSSDGRDPVFVWSVRDGRLLASLREHRSYVGAVAFDPGGGGLITASHDAAFKWDLPRWSVGRTLYSNASIFAGVDSAAGLAWSPDGRFIAGSGMYGPVSITTLANGEVKEITGSKRATLYPPVVFSPDSRYVAADSGDGGLGIWNTSGLRLGVLKGGGGGPIAFSVDGRTLAQSGEDSVTLWSVPTFQRLITLPTGVEEAPGSDLADLIFTPDGSELVGLTLNGTVVRWRSVP